MAKWMACRRCKTLTTEKVCPNCGSDDLTFNWEGVVVITDPLRSQLAKILKIERSGMYALRVW